MKKKRFYIPLLLLLLADRLTKILWADSHFTLIPQVLGVHGTRNTGMAFGMLSGNPLLLATVSVRVLIGVFVYIKKHPVNKLEALGLSLLTGGALGNLIDRIVYGYVIDMLEPLFMNLFIFNIADAGITIGAALLIIALLFGKEETKDGAA